MIQSISKSLIIVFAVTLSIVACSPKKNSQTHQFSGDIFGTQYRVILATTEEHPLDVTKRKVIKKAVAAKLAQIDQIMSHYRQDSELTYLNRAPIQQKIRMSEPMYQVLALSQQLYQKTDGFFDVTLQPLIEFWGFGTQNPRKNLPQQHETDMLKQRIGSDQFVLSVREPQEDQSSSQDQAYLLKKKPLTFNLSAIAKGYAVDQLAAMLEQDYAVHHYLINIGGEIRTSGHKAENQPWKIAIEAPFFNQRVLYKTLAVHTNSMAIASSGDYRNFYRIDDQIFSHTIHPVTGWPVQDAFASVSVIADTTAEADAYATALMAMGKKQAWEFAEKNRLKAYFIIRDAEQHKMQAQATQAFQEFMCTGINVTETHMIGSDPTKQFCLKPEKTQDIKLDGSLDAN